jgi:hypothetical protein
MLLALQDCGLGVLPSCRPARSPHACACQIRTFYCDLSRRTRRRGIRGLVSESIPFSFLLENSPDAVEWSSARVVPKDIAADESASRRLSFLVTSGRRFRVQEDSNSVRNQKDF